MSESGPPSAPRLRALIEQGRAPERAPPGERLRALIERGREPERPPAPASERCGLCGLPVPNQHRHVLDLTNRELHCACQACSVLFDHGAAGGHHYRLIPERCIEVEGLRLDDLAWHALGIPVEMAFFVRERIQHRVRTFYPSPAGVIESQLPLDEWDSLEADNPSLAAIEPDVEALLVDRRDGAARAFIVGIDECYRLAAVVREHWSGFGGGDQVKVEIARFFEALQSRAQRSR